jgi:hypothetical protein
MIPFQNIDFGNLLVIAVIAFGLCIVGLLLFLGLQIIGTTVSTFAGILELFGSIVNGGPIAWCGCLAILVICIGVAGFVLLLANCNANPYSMNFCQFIAAR